MKKKWLSLLLALCLSLPLCLSAALAEAPIHLTFWARMSDLFTEEIADFEALNPGITVEVVGIGTDYDDLVTKYNAAIAADDLPNIGLLGQRHGIPQMYDSGKLLAIEDFMTDEEQNDIMPGFWERFTYKGTRVTVPFQSSMPMLHVNMDLLEKYGVEIPTTYDELMDAAKAIVDAARAAGDNDTYGINFGSDIPWYIQPLVWNHGGQIIHEDGSATIDIPQMVTVLEGLQRMVFEDKSMPANQHRTSGEDFSNGLVAFLFNSCAAKSTFEANSEGKFTYNMAFFPAGESLNVPIGGNSLGIFASTPEEEAASWKFVQYMISADAISKETLYKGYMPFAYSHMESELIQERMQDPIWKTVLSQVEYIRNQPVHPADSTIWNELLTSIEALEADANTSAADEAARIQMEVDDFMFLYE